jgi:hypothetical protein
MSVSSSTLQSTDYIRLSDFNRAARTLRQRLGENSCLELIPLTTSPVKYREGKVSADAYFISYETFLAYQKTNPKHAIKVTGIKSSNDFYQESRDAIKNSTPLFSDDEESAVIITMNERDGESGICYIVLSPSAAKTIKKSDLDSSTLFTPQISSGIHLHLQEMWGDKVASDFREGKGDVTSNEGFRKGDKSAITDKTDEGEIVWLANRSVAAVDPKIALQLKALLFPNNGHVIKPISSRRLRNQHGRIFEEIRTTNTFYRVESFESGRERQFFTIIPDHAVRFLKVDEHGQIEGIRNASNTTIKTLTHAWIYTNFRDTKIFLTDRSEKVVNQMRFSLAGEQENVVRRMLGYSRPEEAEIQGIRFSTKGEKPIDRGDRPKGLTVPEAVCITARFNPLGKATNLDIELSERPHLAQFILEQSERLTIKAGSKEFVLAAT